MWNASTDARGKIAQECLGGPWTMDTLRRPAFLRLLPRLEASFFLDIDADQQRAGLLRGVGRQEVAVSAADLDLAAGNGRAPVGGRRPVGGRHVSSFSSFFLA